MGVYASEHVGEQVGMHVGEQVGMHISEQVGMHVGEHVPSLIQLLLLYHIDSTYRGFLAN